MEQPAIKFNCPRRCAMLPLVARGGRKAPSLMTSHDEFEGISVALDVAAIEMSADHQDRSVGKAGE